MYAHCLHCGGDLGGNDVLEAFPVGRRVAFDEALGRLWVVCAKCERWNLAPFESRWEAIEQAERAYRGTTVRVATDNIGLARWRDGTTLVRVGRPLRPEFAAWRYGDQFGRRRRRAWLTGGVAVAGVGALATGAALTGAGIIALAPLLNVSTALVAMGGARTRLRPLAHPDGDWFLPFGNPRLVPGLREEPWAIEIGWNRRLDSPRMTWRDWLTPGPGGNNGENGRVTLHGELARDTLAKLLPSVNGGGASRARVDEAVSLLDEVGGPERVLPWAIEQRRAWGRSRPSAIRATWATSPVRRGWPSKWRCTRS
ncbi:MAG TPA: hypothetical protein PKE51_13515, partial [Gemmatimonadaceae bacterium]|nr:hypothetical protein [Gemmatimonadaceae bacterium]